MTIIVDEAFHDALDIFSVDASPFDPIDGAGSFVIAGLNTGENFAVVHDIRLKINDGTLVKPRCYEVPGVNVTACAGFGNIVGGILIRWKLRFLRHGRGDCISNFDFLLISANQEMSQHLETLVIERELRFKIRAVYEEMQMILIDEGGVTFVAPCFGIKMKAEDEVRM